MPSIVADIENLKRELERAHSELLQMYQELGETSFAWHDAISYEPSQEPYDKLAGLVNEKEDVDRRIEALKTAVSEMSAGDQRIDHFFFAMSMFRFRDIYLTTLLRSFSGMLSLLFS